MTATFRLGDVVDIVGGGTPAKSRPEYYRGSIPWVTPKDMVGWEITRTHDSITKQALRESSAKLIGPGSVLLVVRSGILKHRLPIAINKVPVTVNQDIKALVCPKEISSPFLARLLQWLEPQILSSVRGTTAHNIPLQVIKDVEVPRISLDEQQRIAMILDKADAIHRKRQGAISLAEELLKAAYGAAVGPSNANYDSWPSVKVVDLADKKQGSMRTGPFGSNLKHSEFVTEGVAVLGIDNAVHNRFAWGRRRFITEDKYQSLKRYTVRPSDVIITIMGTTGRSAVVPADIPLAISTKHLAVITVNRKIVHPEYLSHAIHLDPHVLSQITRSGRGAMAGLNLRIIKDLELRLPPLEIQLRFAEVLCAIRRLEERMRVSLQKSDELSESLCQRAFSVTFKSVER